MSLDKCAYGFTVTNHFLFLTHLRVVCQITTKTRFLLEYRAVRILDRSDNGHASFLQHSVRRRHDGPYATPLFARPSVALFRTRTTYPCRSLSSFEHLPYFASRFAQELHTVQTPPGGRVVQRQSTVVGLLQHRHVRFPQQPPDHVHPTISVKESEHNVRSRINRVGVTWNVTIEWPKRTIVYVVLRYTD